MQQSPHLAMAKGMKPSFLSAMAFVDGHYKRLVEEYLFRFRLPDAMLIGTFPTVAGIPVKPFDPAPVNHWMYIAIIYALRPSGI
jgi:hypothetical protein